ATLRLWIERHSRPHAGLEHDFNRMFFHMINDHSLGLDSLIALDHLQDEPGAFELVFKMGSMDEDELIMPGGEVHMEFEHSQFIPRVLVETDLSDAEHIWPIQKVRNDTDDFLRQFNVLSFLRIDAQPGKMDQTEFGSPFWLVLRQLAEVIVKTVH